MTSVLLTFVGEVSTVRVLTSHCAHPLSAHLDYSNAGFFRHQTETEILKHIFDCIASVVKIKVTDLTSSDGYAGWAVFTFTQGLIQCPPLQKRVEKEQVKNSQRGRKVI